MTMLDEDGLRRLARVAPLGAPRPLTEIRRRTAQLRRGRRAGRLAAGGAVLAVAGLVAQVVVGAGPGGGPLGAVPHLAGAPAAAAGTDCRGYADRVRREDVSPDLRYLLPGDARGRPLKQAWGRHDRWSCSSPAPVAILIDVTNDQTTAARALAVWGPDAVPWGDPRETVRVRGRAGQLVARGETPGVLSVGWTEPDGSRWVVTSSGVGRSDLLSTVDGLRLADGDVVRASLPAGYDQVQFFDPVPASGPRSLDWWDAQYGDEPNSRGDDLGVQLSVVRGAGWPADIAVTLEPLSRIRFVDVNGAQAVYLADGTGMNSLEWQARGGVQLRLSGPLDVTDLAALARQLQPVSATDPRLAGVPDGS